MTRAAIARKGWTKRRKRLNRELRERIEELEVRVGEHYCLLRALEERVGSHEHTNRPRHRGSSNPNGRPQGRQVPEGGHDARL